MLGASKLISQWQCCKRCVLQRCLPLSVAFHTTSNLDHPRHKKTHYEVLGVKSSATTKEIRAAFVEKSKMFHPDSNPHDSESESHNKFVKINEAYMVLSKPLVRQNYDVTLSRQRAAPARQQRYYEDMLRGQKDGQQYGAPGGVHYEDGYHTNRDPVKRYKHNQNAPSRISKFDIYFVVFGGISLFIFSFWGSTTMNENNATASAANVRLLNEIRRNARDGSGLRAFIEHHNEQEKREGSKQPPIDPDLYCPPVRPPEFVNNAPAGTPKDPGLDYSS